MAKVRISKKLLAQYPITNRSNIMYAVIEWDGSYHRATVYVYRHNNLVVELITDSVENAKIVLGLMGIMDIR